MRMFVRMDFLHISESRLKGILKKLNWIEECNSHTSHFGLPLQKCTFDENHWIPPDRTDEHERFCKLRKCGYTKQEIFNMLPTPASAGMDELRRHRTSEPMLSLDSLDLDAFSTSQQKKMRMIQYRLPEDGHRVETLALIRDSKRRSKSYRGIHTARRSYTEILREIIEQQTELLQEAYERQYRGHRKHTKAVEDDVGYIKTIVYDCVNSGSSGMCTRLMEVKFLLPQRKPSCAPLERDYRPRLDRSSERREIAVTSTEVSSYERCSERFSLNTDQPKSTPRSSSTSRRHKRHRHHKKHRHRSPS
ncbi:hypothetical protein CRM22_008051 [Opisthorchis felineus]|uniref:CHHC U11-48K-type domain-containing protein n=1 Tax=Opisthorchis felineus TaxID=147828 RepID=A0A4S2LF26_OPIFE|nr:hypothetical protein CRM22_008051 [Opisthorchis felineus]